MIVRVLAAILLLNPSTPVLQSKPAPGKPAVRSLQGPVQMLPHAPILKDVDAFPRIGQGVTPEIAARINASLARLDARMQAETKDCRAGVRQRGGTADPNPYGRTIEVTMAGPRFVSFLAHDDYDCGGLYPNTGDFAIVYDLQTGIPVDWAKQMPAGTNSALSHGGDGAPIGTVSLPALTAVARKEATEQCKDVFDDEESSRFQVWVDASLGSIAFEPTELPHSVAVCAEPFYLNPDQARRFGIAPEVVESLLAAKSLQK